MKHRKKHNMMKNEHPNPQNSNADTDEDTTSNEFDSSIATFETMRMNMETRSSSLLAMKLSKHLNYRWLAFLHIK